jgi:spore maturation protein CgeB
VRIVIFSHSVLSDWNHGNAHFLRGISTELLARGYDLRLYEPRDAWSLKNLLAEHGQKPLDEFREAYPALAEAGIIRRYDLKTLDLDDALAGADLVLVHEWNDHDLVRRIGEHRRRKGGYRLLFHDTHHRAVTEPKQMAAYDLRHYDGVLAFGEAIRRIYLKNRWAARAWTWHEAADTRVFRPQHGMKPEGDLVWIGNWGDGERTRELHEFLLEPVRTLGLRARVYGVRYPAEAKKALKAAGIEYRGWLPNYRVADEFARHRVTVHVPRGPYARALPGIPTIRPFEALACGIPLVSAPWKDAESLFRPGEEFLYARDGEEMTRALRRVLNDDSVRRDLAISGRQAIMGRHTCSHRVDELLQVHDELQPSRRVSLPNGNGKLNGKRGGNGHRSVSERLLPLAIGLVPLAVAVAVRARDKGAPPEEEKTACPE